MAFQTAEGSVRYSNLASPSLTTSGVEELEFFLDSDTFDFLITCWVQDDDGATYSRTLSQFSVFRDTVQATQSPLGWEEDLPLGSLPQGTLVIYCNTR